jgi:hypothetical protein
MSGEYEYIYPPEGYFPQAPEPEVDLGLLAMAARYRDQLAAEAMMEMARSASHGPVQNAKDFGKGFLRSGADWAGGAADIASMLPLSPPEGGNPYARAIRNMLGPDSEKPFMGSDYIADRTGLQGEGLAYETGRVAGGFGGLALLKSLLRQAPRSLTAMRLVRAP